ncbi:MAG: 50S ribosomal protein L18 [Chloroflexi bacterium]|nr:50S ribosomal protein L18 [Chloroflexota bacterium]
MADIKGKRKAAMRSARHRRVRARVQGTAARPRLNVFRSLANIYAQVIDDSTHRTIVSASTVDAEVATQLEGKNKVDAARIVGRIVAERAKNAGITSVVFDRGGYKYHGRVEALAQAAREAGLEF